MRQWTTLHKYMWLRILQGANAVYETVKGAIISFVTKKAAPLTELKVEFSPVQDLNGYANPWPAGGGKNLWDEQYTGIQESATLVYRAIAVGDGQFTLSTDCPKYTTAAELFLLAGNVDSGASTDTNGVSDGIPRTVTSSGGYVTIAYRAQGGVNPQNYHTQLESGSTPTAYTPYENVCPISGWSSLTVEQRGKNLFDKNNIVALDNAYLDYATKTLKAGGGNRGFVIPCKGAQTYTLSLVNKNAIDLTIACFEETPIVGSVATAEAHANSAVTSTTATVTAGTSDTFLFVKYNNINQTQTYSNDEVLAGTMVVFGSSAPSAYVPYNPSSRSISITFPALGKNLLNPNTLVDGYIRATDGVIVSPSATYQEKTSDFIPIESGEIYRVSMEINNSDTKWIAVAIYDENKTFVSRIGGEQGTSTTPAYTVPGNSTNNAKYIRVSFRSYGIAEKIQTEKGQYTTAYEPYTNTVYGGYADLVLGKLTVEWAKEPMKQENVSLRQIPYGTNPATNYYRIKVQRKLIAESATDSKSDVCVAFSTAASAASYSASTGGIGIVPSVNAGYSYSYYHTLFPHEDGDDATIADARLFSKNPTICYKFTPPIEFDLTPEQINALKGDNVMWANTNGDIEATYRSN